MHHLIAILYYKNETPFHAAVVCFEIGENDSTVIQIVNGF